MQKNVEGIVLPQERLPDVKSLENYGKRHRKALVTWSLDVCGFRFLQKYFNLKVSIFTRKTYKSRPAVVSLFQKQQLNKISNAIFLS
jgi:hypothetical protein